MNIDELRNRIWDHLYRAKTSSSIAELALLTNCDAATVDAAVNHEWFVVTDGRISIAYAESVNLHR